MRRLVATFSAVVALLGGVCAIGGCSATRSSLAPTMNRSVACVYGGSLMLPASTTTVHDCRVGVDAG